MTNKKYTAILLYPRYSEYELSVTLSVLQQGGKPVIFVGLDNNIIRGEAGLPCIPETTIHELDLNLVDSLLLPGVDDIEHLIEHKDLALFLNNFDNNERIIGAISSAAYFLSMSNLLKDKKYTVGLPKHARDFLGTFIEENFVNSPIVIDKNLLTGIGSAFIDFAFAYGELLNLNFDKSWYISNNKF